MVTKLRLSLAGAVVLLTTALPVSGADNCRRIAHAMGVTCVPEQPRRIVALDTGELDIAYSLGVIPVAATTPYQQESYPGYLDLPADQIIHLGMNTEPDLERILQLQPDLILGSQHSHAHLYPTLSRIAPTVFSASVGYSWADNLQLFATALNREALAGQRLAQINQRCRQIQAIYREKQSPRISIVRSMQDHVRLYLQETFIHNLLQRCQIKRPPVQDQPGFAIRLRSPRHIQQLNGDLILLSEYTPRKGSLIRRWQRTRFWDLLEGELQTVDDSYWMLGIGPSAALAVLDDLEQILEQYEPE